MGNRGLRAGAWLVRHGVPDSVFWVCSVFGAASSVAFPALTFISWLFILPGVAGVLLAVFSEYLRDMKQAAIAASRKAVDQERIEQFGTAIRGALQPLSLYLGKIASSTRAERPALALAMGEAVVASVVQILGNSHDERSNLRSAFYRLVEDESVEVLRRQAFTGRSNHLPREEFRPNSRESNDLIRLVKENKVRIIDDAENYRNVVPSNPGDYKQVMSCAVNVAGVPLGLLTVDAPGDIPFTNDDEVFMRAIAGLYGAAILMSISPE